MCILAFIPLFFCLVSEQISLIFIYDDMPMWDISITVDFLFFIRSYQIFLSFLDDDELVFQ